MARRHHRGRRIAIAVFLINLVWFRPWSLNLFYEKVFAEVLFDHPELLSALGLVEQFRITRHTGKLDDESPAHQQREFERWKRDLAQLHEYPLEGWALYCEWLARQVGWYNRHPFRDLGRLRDELFRAIRLVVDTGIHAKYWTHDQAMAYMREKTGMGEKEVKSEIERYIVAPGQACAYKTGMLKIQELRARAQKELGERFDQREFHAAVLKNGALPLEILEEQVNDYIQRKKA
jgi:hypothetical protein